MNRKDLKEKAKASLGGKIFEDNWLKALLVCFIASIIVSAAASIGMGIGGLIIAGPISYGMAYVLIELVRNKKPVEISDLFKGFDEDFKNNFLIGLMTSIYVFLWSLLFVIPGIVKTYAYSFAFYIKKDHPEYDWSKCIEESKRLTEGHKMDLFILDLSFIGWYFVGSLCFGIGTLFVVPYHNATKIQFYEELKK